MTKLDIFKIVFSKRDEEKDITIPKYLTPELAEDIGIHIGDGSMYSKKGSKNANAITISSNINEIDYLKYVIDIKKRLYNLNKYRILERNNERNLRFHSLAISTFYNTIFNLPIGKKDDIDIPELIKNSKDQEIIISFVRGIIDTDFGLSGKNRHGKIYPCLEGSSKSKKLIKSIANIFDKLNINYYLEYDVNRFDKRTNKITIINKIILNGFKRINLFFRIVQPKNSKYIKKMKKMWARGDLNSRPLAFLNSC